VNEKENLKKMQKASLENGVLIGKWKLTYDILGDKWEMYDLSEDKNEKTNLVMIKPEIVKELRNPLDKFIISSEKKDLSKQDKKVILSEKETEILKSLGYLQ